MKIVKFFDFRGIVQRVQFRRTVLNAAKKRGVEGGATNNKKEVDLVHVTLRGEKHQLEGLVNHANSFMRDGVPLNERGALITSIEEKEEGLAIEEHEYTTENFELKKWSEYKLFF